MHVRASDTWRDDGASVGVLLGCGDASVNSRSPRPGVMVEGCKTTPRPGQEGVTMDVSNCGACRTSCIRESSENDQTISIVSRLWS